jgi:hypothetical protein
MIIINLDGLEISNLLEVISEEDCSVDGSEGDVKNYRERQNSPPHMIIYPPDPELELHTESISFLPI